MVWTLVRDNIHPGTAMLGRFVDITTRDRWLKMLEPRMEVIRSWNHRPPCGEPSRLAEDRGLKIL